MQYRAWSVLTTRHSIYPIIVPEQGDDGLRDDAASDRPQMLSTKYSVWVFSGRTVMFRFSKDVVPKRGPSLQHTPVTIDPVVQDFLAAFVRALQRIQNILSSLTFIAVLRTCCPKNIRLKRLLPEL